MHRPPLVAALALACALGVASLVPLTHTDQPAPAAVRVESGTPVRYVDPIFAPDEIHRSTHVYGSARDVTGRRVDLDLDLYRGPARDRATKRAIVFVHGGGFLTRSTRHKPAFTGLVRYFARLGYVTVSIEYRRRTYEQLEGRGLEGAVRDASYDAKAAVRWLRRYADYFHVDRSRIALAGTSAGAMTALRAAYSEDEGTSGNPGRSSQVRAVVDLWGSLRWERRQGGWMRDGIPLMEPGEAPVIIVHGTADRTVPYREAEDIRDRAELVGVPYRFEPIEGADHGTYTFSPTLKSWVADFLVEHLA